MAIEDRRFYQHGALDYQGIVRAGVKDLLGDGNALQGASTLTMQLVNNMFIPAELPRAPRPQVQDRAGQAGRATRVQALQAVDPRLLPERVPYGTSNGQEAVGVGAAALMFFNRPVSKLNLAQMSLLAGLPQSPSQYDPLVYPKLAKARRNAVLQAMVTSHYISQGLATAVEKQPLQVHRQQPLHPAQPAVHLRLRRATADPASSALRRPRTAGSRSTRRSTRARAGGADRGHRPRGRRGPRRPARGGARVGQPGQRQRARDRVLGDVRADEVRLSACRPSGRPDRRSRRSR